MSPRDEWLEIVGRVNGAPKPSTSPAWPDLYRVAQRDGLMVLGKSFRDIDPSRRIDLIHDLLTRRSAELLAARNPRGLFLVSLQNAAKDWVRSPRALVVSFDGPAGGPGGTTSPEDDVSERLAFARAARAVLASLGDRDRQILLALAYGEEVADVARTFATTEGNVYKIQSRARARLRVELEGDDDGAVQ